MADRYQGRSFPANNEYDRGEDPYASARGDSDPLAELARLIGQTDPFGTTTDRPNQQVPRRTNAEPEAGSPPAGPPPWMQRVNRQEARQEFRHQASPQDDAEPDDYPRSVHPLQRYAAVRPAPERNDHETTSYADEPDHDPSRYDRYDDALYGQPDVGESHSHADQAYADDAYGYQDDYDEGVEEQPKRRGGMVTVAVVLALAVLGTGAALAYRTFVGSPRGGEPPIIRADTSPTKIMPAPADATAKLPDRLVSGDSTERIVPREEAPVDINTKAGPRVVFPPLNQNGNPPSAGSVAPGSGLTSAAGGTLPNSEPRKIRTLAVHGEQPDGAAMPTTSAPQPPKPGQAAPAARVTAPPVQRGPPTSANASAATPLALVPADNPAAEPRTRVANTNPTQPAPAAPPAPAAATGAYLVQVSSQRNEADAQASYRALQGKFPAVLGSHAPVIKRADLGDKGVYYRAMVGPFATSEEASQFCGNLKSAGGQCVVQRN
jgi:cell division protein FtsN